MKFMLTIEMGNDAMSSRADIAHALAAAAAQVDADMTDSAWIFDGNGNRCGRWEFGDE